MALHDIGWRSSFAATEDRNAPIGMAMGGGAGVAVVLRAIEDRNYDVSVNMRLKHAVAVVLRGDR